MPNIYIISGCNGSGKTTASYAMLPEMLKCSQFVNSDEFAKGLSPFNPDMASVQASRYMLLKIRYLLDRKADFAIETTLATRSLLKMVQKAQEAGYNVTVLFFWLNSQELAIERVKARVLAGGHNIPEDVIRRRYIAGLRYFFEDYMPIVDRWILADNSKIPFKIIAQGWRNNMVVKDNLKFEAIRAQAKHYKELANKND
ncbi:Predicted ABC-type ATPase [Bacteroidales bacterium WCE2008]|nr:zeta toxin family protein [Candidatus Cryptobacteroides sp.]SKC55755.1 Predicted ABC-type ATPase [Bacteroidales bacterium WCE2008]